MIRFLNTLLQNLRGTMSPLEIFQIKKWNYSDSEHDGSHCLSAHRNRLLITKQYWFCVNLVSDLSVFFSLFLTDSKHRIFSADVSKKRAEIQLLGSNLWRFSSKQLISTLFYYYTQSVRLWFELCFALLNLSQCTQIVSDYGLNLLRACLIAFN